MRCDRLSSLWEVRVDQGKLTGLGSGIERRAALIRAIKNLKALRG